MFGKEPSEIVIPYNKEQLDALLMFDEDWQTAIGNYCGQILHHLPSYALLIQKLKEGEFKYGSPHQILQHALFVINNLNDDLSGTPAMLHHWCLEQQNVKPLVKWKDLLSRQWKGSDPLLTSSRGYACVFPQDADSPIWVPERLIHHVAVPQVPDSSTATNTKNKKRIPLSKPPQKTATHQELRAGPASLMGHSALCPLAGEAR